VVSNESVKDFFKQQTLKEPKFVLFDKVLHKWFTAMLSEGKPETVPIMVIEKAKYFYDEMKRSDKCTFCEDSKKKLLVET
jgi:hypothetical protein